jgi:hypothetical protein
MPQFSLPLLSWSTNAKSSARRNGWCIGSRVTAVPSRIRDVIGAAAASIIWAEAMIP